MKSSNRKFWRLAQKHPQKAYQFFNENDCWYVIHPNKNKSKPQGDWSGSLIFPIDGIGKLKLYGRNFDFEIKQQEFIDIIEKNNAP